MAQDGGAGSQGTELLRTATPQYGLSVHVRPERLVAGIGQFEVTLERPGTGEPVRGAVVRLFAAHPDGGERQTARALDTPARPGRYVSKIEFDRAGQWAMEVEVAYGGTTFQAPFEAVVQARTRASGSTFLGSVVWAVMSAAIFGGALWLVYSSKRARRRRSGG